MIKRQDAEKTRDSYPHDGGKPGVSNAWARVGGFLSGLGHFARRPKGWVARLLPGGIRERLFLLIALTAVPVLILQGSIYYQRHAARRNQSLQTEVEVAQGIAATFSAYLDGVHRQLDAIGQAILAFSPYSDANVQRLLDDAVARHPSVRSMNWVSPEGKILVSNLADGVGRDLSVRPYFQRIQAGESWAVGDMTAQGAILDTPTVAMGAAVRDDDGRLLGVVVASIEPTRLGELTFPHERHTGGVYTIIDSQGHLVYRNPAVPLTWEDRVRWRQADALLPGALAGQITRGVIMSPVARRRVVAARVPIPGTGWVAGAARAEEIAMGPVWRALFQDALLGLLVASLALLLASLVARTIADPLRRLEHDAQAMGAGVIEPPGELQAPTEVSRLRDSVSAMAAGLIERADALRDSEERYRTLFTNMSEGFALGEAVFHEDGAACDFHFLEINDAFEQQTGLKREILGRSMTEVLPNLEQHWIDTYCGVARMGESVRFVNYNQDTGRHYDVFCYSPVKNRFAILFRDVTERVRAEQAIRGANEQLQEQTEELQVQAEELQAQAEELRITNETLEGREREYRTLAENAPEVIARFDRQLRHTYVNAYGARVYGVPQREAIGKTNADLGMPADKVAFWRERFEQVLATGRQQTVDFEFDSPTFGHQYFSSLFVPEFDARGEIVSILAITRDVTAVKLAEQMLREEKAFSESTITSMPGIFYLFDSRGKFVKWNRNLEQVSGYTADEIARMHPLDFFSGEDKQLIERRIQEVFADGQASAEAQLVAKDGRRIPYYFTGITATIGGRECLSGMGMDISERKQAEQALRSVALFPEENPSPVLRVARDGTLLYANASSAGLLDLWNCQAGQMVPEEIRGRIERTLDAGQETETEIACGEIVYSFSFAPIASEDYVNLYGRDITERKRAAEAVRRSESFYRQTLESIPGMVFTTRPDGYFDYQSQQWVDYTGVPMAEHLSDGWNKLLHPEDRPRALAAWRAAVEDRATYDLEYRVRRHDGQYEWFKVIGRPIRDEAGQIVRWFGVAINIQALKRVEEAMRELTETLESRVVQRTAELEHRTRQLQKLTLELSETEDRERRRLADILHDDLQQQLAAVKFHLGLLSNRTKYDPAAQRATVQLDRMLSNAVETSRSLSHELSPALLYQGGLGETLEWLANQIRTKHGLTVHVHVDGEIIPESDALKAFLYKTAQEMLFNVVKHARIGEARVRVRRMGRCLCLVVSDRGRGFNPQDLKATAGFGLFSIRERVQLLGGRMEIRSAKGKGSTFFVAVPDGPTTQSAEQAGGWRPEAVEGSPVSSLQPPLRVLVADDHEIVRQGLAALLREQQDIQFIGEAANGREAVDMANRLRPDVVIMDVAMPLMNGDEATRQTKMHLPDTRVIALSMYAEEAMVERMRRAGADGYILKTAPADELLAAVRGKKACA